MCLIRKFREKFQIYQNNENVYSYGECRTVGPINDYYPTQVKDKPCHDKPKWYLNVSCKKKKVGFLNPKPNFESQSTTRLTFVDNDKLLYMYYFVFDTPTYVI